MRKVLKPEFFQKPALTVAKELIGKYLVRKTGKKEIAHMVTETEAYVGESDLACHASKGRTKRTEVMFESGGVFYVYLVYGMYSMLNIVTGEKGCPEAVLIRGLENLNGPGVLTKKLEIDLSLKGKTAEKNNGLWFEDREIKISKKLIKETPRIGVNYAGPVWSKKLYRFLLDKYKLPSFVRSAKER